ncbi:enoyl-CoA hydratase [Rhodococcus koreensis]|uniref:enoyl-CoA hydratase n=1 Tax=Rhodococcus koreensis TaxID=99653 RepID=UPI0036DD168F
MTLGTTTSTENLHRVGRHATIAHPRPGVAIVTLVDSKSMNILGSAPITDLTEAVQQVAAEPELRVLVLRGDGDRAFLGGGDIFEMAQLQRDSAEAFITRLKGLCDALQQSPVPVISRLSGWCLGGGLEVAMACDLRIAERGAQFGMPEVAVGIPSVIHSALMPGLIGWSRASYLLLTGENIDATTALDWGLVQEVVEPDHLDERVEALVERFVSFGPSVVRQQKALLSKWSSMTTRGAIEDSVQQFGLAFLTGEPQHHMGRFVAEKRR